MAVSIRLKHGIFERFFDKYIDKYEYVTFITKTKKTSKLLDFSLELFFTQRHAGNLNFLSAVCPLFCVKTAKSYENQEAFIT